MTPKEYLDRAIRVANLKYWRLRPEQFDNPDPEILDLCATVRELEAVVDEFNETIKKAGFKHRLHLEAWCDDAPPGYAEGDPAE